MLYRFVWLYGRDSNIEVINKGRVWHEDEELCRKAGEILQPSIDYPESELSHLFCL